MLAPLVYLVLRAFRADLATVTGLLLRRRTLDLLVNITALALGVSGCGPAGPPALAGQRGIGGRRAREGDVAGGAAAALEVALRGHHPEDRAPACDGDEQRNENPHHDSVSDDVLEP